MPNVIKLDEPAGGWEGVQPPSSDAELLRVGVCISNDGAPMGDELLATGTGKAVRTPAVPARVDLENPVGAQHRRLRPGSPVTTDKHLIRRDGGKPREHGMLEAQLRKPDQEEQRH